MEHLEGDLLKLTEEHPKNNDVNVKLVQEANLYLVDSTRT